MPFQDHRKLEVGTGLRVRGKVWMQQPGHEAGCALEIGTTLTTLAGQFGSMKSLMNREVHVRFFKKAGVRFHGLTWLPANLTLNLPELG